MEAEINQSTAQIKENTRRLEEFAEALKKGKPLILCELCDSLATVEIFDGYEIEPIEGYATYGVRPHHFCQTHAREPLQIDREEFRAKFVLDRVLEHLRKLGRAEAEAEVLKQKAAWLQD